MPGVSQVDTMEMAEQEPGTMFLSLSDEAVHRQDQVKGFGYPSSLICCPRST